MPTCQVVDTSEVDLPKCGMPMPCPTHSKRMSKAERMAWEFACAVEHNIDSLIAEVERLKAELAERGQESQRLRAELAELREENRQYQRLLIDKVRQFNVCKKVDQ